MKTWHIHLMGMVQGIGFRPYIYRLATELSLDGVVYNDLDGLHIQFVAKEETAIPFYKSLLEGAPNLAKITGHTISKVKEESFQDFQILQNQEVKTAALMLPPDFAVCESCKTEILSGDNRRALYPFTTCTQCDRAFL